MSIFRRSVLSLAAVIVTVLTVGCIGTLPNIHPDNPWVDLPVRKVAVFPFENGTDVTLDMEALTNRFCSELTNFQGFDKVIRPKEVVDKAKVEKIGKWDFAGRLEKEFTKEQRMQLAGILGVDAFFVGVITEYPEVYPPLSMSFSLQLWTTGSVSHGATDIDRLIMAGKPIPIDSSNVDEVIFSMEKLIDGHSEKMRREIRDYAKTLVQSDTAHSTEEEVVRVVGRFFTFVSNYMMRQAFKDWKHVRPMEKTSK